MVLLNSCCCCCNLKTGGVILGYLGIISSIFQIIVASYVLNEPGLLPNNTDLHGINFGCSLSIGMSVIYMLLSMALLWGAHKGQRYLLVPWLFTVGILTFVSIIVVLTVGGIFLAADETQYIGIILYVVYLPLSGLQIYFWICVLSLFQKLRSEEYTTADAFPINQVTVTTTNNPYNMI